MTKREKLGKISTELSSKQSPTQSPIELEREMQKEYYNNLIIAAERGKKDFEGDFFIHVETKNERLMKNVFRNYFFPRKSCPTPNYDQSVYMYTHADEEIRYLWTVPSKDACYYLRDNALIVVPEERELLRFVLEFIDGSLLRKAKQLNGERHDSPLLES